MGSSTLAGTKRRINSVRSTLKITSAMKVVATAKLKGYRDKMGKGSFYLDKMREVLAKVTCNMEDDDSDNINMFATGDKKLILVISSSLGLCGAYNTNINKLFHKNYKEGDEVLVVGHKIASHLDYEHIPYDDQFINAYQGFDYSVSRKIGKYLMEQFKTKKYGSVLIIGTHYVNSIKFQPTAKVLFPIVADVKSTNPADIYAIIEPSPQKVYKELLPQYVNSLVNNIFLESAVSEYSSRRNAMENASDNAEEIIDELELQYNKARQAQITQDITEVVSGANANK